MAYGIQVFNSVGGTIFDSEHYVELGAYTTTVSDTGTVAIPDWCFGMDQAVDLNTYTHDRVTSGVTYNNVYEIAIKLYDTGGVQRPTYEQHTKINYLDAYVISASFTQYGSGSDIYRIYTMSKDMTGIRTTTGSNNLTAVEVTKIRPSLYARPLSGTYSGKFWGSIGTYAVTDASFDPTDKLNSYAFIQDDQVGTTTFEIMVALPSYVFGGVSGTKAYHAGSTDYGLQVQSTADQKHTPSGSLVQFTTYDTRGRPAKPQITTSHDVPAKAVLNVSMGSLATSTTKRWCRLNGTEYFLAGTPSWRWAYNWTSNNSIALIFTDYFGGGIFDTLESKQFFAVSEFGTGL